MKKRNKRKILFCGGLAAVLPLTAPFAALGVGSEIREASDSTEKVYQMIQQSENRKSASALIGDSASALVSSSLTKGHAFRIDPEYGRTLVPAYDGVPAAAASRVTWSAGSVPAPSWIQNEERETLGGKNSIVYNLDQTNADGVSVVYDNYYYYDPADSNAVRQGKWSGYVPVKVTARISGYRTRPWKFFEKNAPAYVHPYAAFGKSLEGGLPAVDIVGVEQAEISYSFAYGSAAARTPGRPYTIKSNVTYNDVDNGQAMAVQGGVTQAAVTDDTALYAGLTAKKRNTRADNGDIYLFADAGDLRDAEDVHTPEKMFGITYHSSRLKVTYYTGSSGTGGKQSDWQAHPGRQGVRAWFATSRYSFWKTYGELSKQVSDLGEGADETGVTENTVPNIGSSWRYELSYRVPAGIADNAGEQYSSFVWKDAIDTCLVSGDGDAIRPSDIRIVSEEGRELTGRFDILVANNEITARAKEELLADADFYGTGRKGSRIRLLVDVSVRPEARSGDRSRLDPSHRHGESEQEWIFRNRGELTVDGMKKETEQTVTHVPVPKPEEPEKTVTDADETKVTSNSLRHRYETMTYCVRQKLPAGLLLESLVWEDQLDSCLDAAAAGVQLRNKKGEDLTGCFAIDRTDGKITARAKPEALKSGKLTGTAADGGELSLFLTVGLRKNLTEEELEAHRHFSESRTRVCWENRASVAINGTRRFSNQTRTSLHLTTKTDPRGENEGAPGLAVEKQADHFEGKPGEETAYTIQVENRNPQADATDLKVQDLSLPRDLKVRKDSIEIKGADPGDYILDTAPDNGWILRQKKGAVLPYGKILTITFRAEADGAAAGKTVTNTAAARAYAVPEVRDRERVWINREEDSIEKTAGRDKYRVGEEVEYRLSVSNRKPGTLARHVVIQDRIRTKGIRLLPDSITLLDPKGTLIKDAAVSVGENGFEIVTNRNLVSEKGAHPFLTETDRMGKEEKAAWEEWNGPKTLTGMTVTYRAVIEDGKLAGEKGENTAEVRSDQGKAGTAHTVTVKAPGLNMDKLTGDTWQNPGDTPEYTLLVTQDREKETARRVTVTDQILDPGAHMDRDSIAVTWKNKEITETCKIRVKDTSFRIDTGVDLSYGEELKVTYRTKLDPDFRRFDRDGKVRNRAAARGENTPGAEDLKEIQVTEPEHITEVADASGSSGNSRKTEPVKTGDRRHAAGGLLAGSLAAAGLLAALRYRFRHRGK
ncbi:MAG: DUF11 domain-containing protein [Lachnospiraceae bacterium]|jgi:fimbrial isopeptide formation D2 family protein|nr:DUF11 domain-containing protein [Lachnospiraceae bacterium]MCI1658111.1 DUF11 domain-containing protein [Lachnospiraceae bacterium]